MEVNSVSHKNIFVEDVAFSQEEAAREVIQRNVATATAETKMILDELRSDLRVSYSDEVGAVRNKKLKMAKSQLQKLLKILSV